MNANTARPYMDNIIKLRSMIKIVEISLAIIYRDDHVF